MGREGRRLERRRRCIKGEEIYGED